MQHVDNAKYELMNNNILTHVVLKCKNTLSVLKQTWPSHRHKKLLIV